MTLPSEHADRGLFVRHRKAILFLTCVLGFAGVYSALTMPASVFPQTDFPRVVVLIDNGVMPADEMMATITRPVEEAMKGIPGTSNIRSATGRGSAEINVFFEWATDMVQAELFVLGRIAQIRSRLPDGAEVAVHRLTFSAFPVLGVSLTSSAHNIADLWELARYELNPRFLRIPGVARVKLVGGRRPEYHVIVDPVRLEALDLGIEDVSSGLLVANTATPAGMHEENRQLYLTVVDNRLRSREEIENVVIAQLADAPIRVRDVADVRRGEAPAYNVVSADGSAAILFNVYAQPDGDTTAIADALHATLASLRRELPPDMRLALFYDQSVFVREGMRSVRESILIGLALSMLVLYAFLRSLSAMLVAGLVIPLTVLATMLGMKLFGMSFNLMTMGGIAAAIGLIIDDAIVVIEAIHTQVRAGHRPTRAVSLALREVGPALIGSTLTPTVVFLPLAFLDGVTGVFFRSLALTMVFGLMSSLVLAVTWTPAIAGILIRNAAPGSDAHARSGTLLNRLASAYEIGVRWTMGHLRTSTVGLVLVIVAGVFLYSRVETDFLPEQDEGAFVLDYFTRPGTSLAETDRMLRHVEQILVETPAIESFSRRTGARLALAIAEPNTGDFLVKLRPHRERSTAAVIDDLRERIHTAEPALHTEFPGVLADLIGDLTWSPDPVEIKVFANDPAMLTPIATKIATEISKIPGVVDVNDGLVVAGPSLSLRVRGDAGGRAGWTPAGFGESVRTALLGTVASRVLRGDRTYPIRIRAASAFIQTEDDIRALPLRSPTGQASTVDEIATLEHVPGILEMHREDLRQLTAVSARFSGIDLGHGIAAIQQRLAQTLALPRGVHLEFGGLYRQQQDSFRNLGLVLLCAIALVYAVLILEFRAVLQPLAIVIGSVLALLGALGALMVSGITLNIVSFLGAIIGVGIVAKNGILMLDHVEQLRNKGLSTIDALVQSGRRRLRPVLMTSMTTFLGLLPLAWGVGAGADMLRPLAIAVLGSLLISLGLSLVATPTIYYALLTICGKVSAIDEGGSR
jgi:CzcA family heavy metal efflux pump